jgi:hypothetical protein
MLFTINFYAFSVISFFCVDDVGSDKGGDN